MWHDNETERDFLNFSGVSNTVAEMIAQAAGRPISIGVSGIWGIGKSSMIKLIRRELDQRQPPPKFIFVEFNAWLYQGYDDARAALMDVIAERLNEEAETQKTGIDKAKELLGRVVSPYDFEVIEEIPTPFENGVMIMQHLTRNVVEAGDYGFMVGNLEGSTD